MPSSHHSLFSYSATSFGRLTKYIHIIHTIYTTIFVVSGLASVPFCPCSFQLYVTLILFYMHAYIHIVYIGNIYITRSTRGLFIDKQYVHICLVRLKVGFHYPSSRPEFTGRVDGPRTRVVETDLK